jgi:carboxypeptidase C (cathepsin A)
MTEDLYSGLVQWFKLFPEFHLNPFYVFGESYGAKFAILIAKKIDENNQERKQLKVAKNF